MKLGKHVKSQLGLLLVILEAKSSCWAIDKNKQSEFTTTTMGQNLSSSWWKRTKKNWEDCATEFQIDYRSHTHTHTHIACDRRDVVVGGGAQWALNLVVAQSSMACLQKDYLHTTHINGMHARDIPFLSLSLSLSLSL
jgi:hypothetical protein